MNITLLGDIAGRVSRETLNADRVTVASVAIPSGAVKYVRKRLPKYLPKWRDATDTDVDLVVNLILREAMGASAASIEKEPVAWERFWSQAADAYSRLAPHSADKISFVKAATVIKCALFGQTSSLTMSQVILTRQLPRPNFGRGLALIRESLVLDDEIQGDENIETFRDLWIARNSDQPLTNLLGIHVEVVGLSLATEQEEPLLLLADYVAGLAHAANSNAEVLRASKVSRACATRAHLTLNRFPRYAEISEVFSYRYEEIFPSLEFLLPNAGK